MNEPIMAAVLLVAERAASRYGPVASSHEAYGVLVEEMAELLDAIRANDLNAIKAEAIDIAAVAIRLAEADGEYKDRSRK